MSTHLHQMPRRVYPLRVLGMGLGGVVTAVVLQSRDASLAAWLGVLLPGFVWPHVAYWLAKRSADPYRAEIRNLLIDSAITGAWVPLMHYGLLPSVLLCTLTMVDKITTGIKGLWARSVPGMLGAGLAVGLVTGAPVVLENSLTVLIACMPVLMLHTLSVSVVSYRLIRKVSRQNQELEVLRRIDAVTGLYDRAHWEAQAQEALRRHVSTGAPASLLMLDIDQFKMVNDSRGHTTGDEVIRVVAAVVRDCLRAGDCAGRYGGDEFAVVLPGASGEEAAQLATRIREKVEHSRFRDFADLRVTSSIGVAALDSRHATLLDWLNSADAALYEAKATGRNRVVTAK